MGDRRTRVRPLGAGVIRTGKDGRRWSERTLKDDRLAVADGMALMPPRARELFEALLSEADPGRADRLARELEEGLYHTPPVSMQQFLEDPYYLGESTTTLYPALRAVLVRMFEHPYREVLLAGSIGLDSLVQEADGALPTLGERLGRDGDVAVLLDSGQATSTTEPAHHSGIKEALRLTLANGMRVDLTPDHEVRVWRREEGYCWVPASELVRGDLVVVPRTLRTSPSSDLGVDEAQLLAYWVADGSSSETRARFDDGNPRTSEEVLLLLERLGFHGKRYPIGKCCWEVSVSRVKRSGFLDWLRKYGADRKTADVIVPDAVCRAPDAVVAAFLNRLWACEGCVYAPPSACSPPRFTLSMTSERFIRQVQMLLLRFGVRARIYHVPYVDRRSGAQREIWHLAVSGIDQLQKFVDRIGIILGKEEACARMVAYCETHRGNTNVDLIPMRGRELSARMTAAGIARSTGTRWWSLASMVRGRMSRQLFEQWAAEFGGTELGQELVRAFPVDLAFEPVISVEPLALAIPVGDVGAHNGNRFLANGINVHNSIGYGKTFLASIAFCRILYELSCLRDIQATFGVGPGTEMVLMLVSKSLPLCREVLKTAVDDKIKLSPYFMGKFPPKFSTDFTLFPNNVRLAIGSYGAERALGKAIVASILDECLGKNCLLTVQNGDSFEVRSVGELWGAGEAARDDLRVEALDHATGQRAWVPFRMRESTVQPLVHIETTNTCSRGVAPSLDHPVLVRRGDALIYLPAAEVRVGDETVWRVEDAEEGPAFVGGGESKNQCFPEGETRASTHGGGPAADLGGERAVDPGSGADLPVPCLVALWRDGSMPVVARAVPGAAPLLDAGGAQCGGRGSVGVYPLLDRGAAAPHGGRLSGDAERRGTGAGRVEVADELLQATGPGAVVGAVGVGAGSRNAADPGAELEAAAECVDGAVRDGGVYGGGAQRAGALPHHADGRDLGGCRSEWLPCAALPAEYQLLPVTAVRQLPPEQTYAIETACQTFVADGCVVHNTNFPPKRNAQQIQQTMGKELTAAHFDIVEKVYRSLVRRIKSRFERVSGDVPGMVLLASSAATLDSFTERKIRESNIDPDVFVVEHSQWSARPADFFSGKVFHVLCSKSSLRTRILDPGEIEGIDDAWMEEHEAWVVEVPEEFRDDFESNLEDSLRDIAGVSTQAISAFFQRVEAIDACIVERPHPFSDYVWVAGSPGSFDWKLLCRMVQRRLPGGYTEDAWLPREAPSAPRWIHIDVSTNRDYTGFVMARIDRWVEVVRRDGDGNRFTDTAPYYIIEVLLSIRPPTGEQIYMPDLRRLVYELQAHGYPIAGFSTDKYEHVEMHQQIGRKGIHTELISMDTTMDPYEELKSAIYERRIEYYHHELLLAELRALECDRVKGKVDHQKHKCFTGETRVALADGTCPTFRELAQRTDSFYVYSMRPDGVCIAEARNARVTMVATELVEVLLDNFQVVRCTPEHLFMTLDQEWVQAQHLTPDVRIMPLYRTVAPMGGTMGYERVWCPVRRDRLLTHRLAAGLPPPGTVVHHRDMDKTNNDPRNLEVMERSAHYHHHGAELWELRRAAMREGHQRYVDDRGRRVSSETMRRSWAEGKFGPPRGMCSIEGCDRSANARGLCDLHYQRARRRGALPEKMEKMGENHRVLRVTLVSANEEVYDLSVPETENFALASGVFVHNSKDLADACAGAIWGLRQRAARLPWAADADTPKGVVGHEHQWVSPLIPAEEVDLDEVRAAQRAREAPDRLPAILFGDDD